MKIRFAIIFLLIAIVSCKKENMDSLYFISGQILDAESNEPAAGETIFISGFDGKIIGRDELKFQEPLPLDDEGRFGFAYSKLFTNNKASRSGQYILITDDQFDEFEFDFDFDTRSIIDSLSWNTNYDSLVIFHNFN